MKNLTLHHSPLGRAVLASALVLVVGAPQGLSQGDDEALKQRFLQEAPSRWEEYARLSGELQGVLSVLHTGTLNAYRDDNQIEYKTNGRGQLIKISIKRSRNGKVEREGEEVFGFNPRYAFILQRKSPNSPWVVIDLFDRSKSTDLGRVAVYLNDYLAAVSRGVRLRNESLAEALRKPEFRIEDCRKVQRGREELVEVAFTYSKLDGKAKVILKGKLVFDPQRYWCLRSADISQTGDLVSGTEKIWVMQSDNAGELPPLSRVYESDGNWVSSAGWSNHQRLRYEATLSQPRRPPGDEEFTLSAFGLPEPPGLEWKRPTPWYLWVGLAGIVCLVLGVGVRWLWQRAAASRR